MSELAPNQTPGSQLGPNETLGLVCVHHHLYSALARGMPAPPRTPTEFIEILELIWWRLDCALDDDLIHWSVSLGAVAFSAVIFLLVRGGLLRPMRHIADELERVARQGGEPDLPPAASRELADFREAAGRLSHPAG